MKTRIYFLDNLRTFIIFLVILLHSAIAYTPFLENFWIINDTQKSGIAGHLVIYIDIFVMFIMFFISGYFIPSSFKKRSFLSFIGAKFRRIMIPWLIAVFTLIPLYKVIFLYSRGMPQQEWYSYFHFFTREGGNLGLYADNPTQSWLWFLPVLFLFQVAYALLAKTGIFRMRIRLNLAISMVFVLSLIYSLTIASLDLNGWQTSPIFHFQRERLLAYFLFFLLGSLCFKLKVFDAHRNRPAVFITALTLLAIGLLTFTVLSNNYFENLLNPDRNQFIISEAGDGIMYYFSIYLCVFAIMYILIQLFRRFFNRSGLLAVEFSRNSYAVYILHMGVIGAVSIPLLAAGIPALIKMSLVSVLTFVICNILISAYRRLAGNTLSSPVIRYAAVAILLATGILAYAQGQGTGSSDEQIPRDIHAPAMSIHMAAIYGDTATLRKHIAAGTDINQKEPSAGSTPLISASLFGKTEVARMLIEAGADINYQNNDGSTALHTASFFCREDIVVLLLENGADKNIINSSGSTALASVLAPWEMVSGIYDYFANSLGPLGLEIDKDFLRENRPEIANLLNQ